MTDGYTEAAPGRLLPLTNGWEAFIPNELPPQIDSAAVLSTVFEAGQELGTLSSLSSEHASEAVRKYLLHQEAVATSRLEGLDVGLDTVYQQTCGHSQLIPEHQRVDAETAANWIQAFEYGRNNSLDSDSVDMLCGVHKKLLGGLHEEKKPGEVRQSQNYIGGLYGKPTYVPPPPHHVRPLLENVVEFTNDDTSYPAVVTAALAHYQFEAIHPFLDGNGRTGRIWLVLSLINAGILEKTVLPVSVYLNTHRSTYTDLLLQVSQEGTWEEWLEFLLTAISEQARATQRVIRVLSESIQEDSAAYSGRSCMSMVVEAAYKTPYFSVEQMVSETDKSYPSVNRAVAALSEKGVLTEVTGNDRNRVFRANWLDEYLI